MKGTAREEQAARAPQINLLSFNCWGLKYLAAHRHARLCAIGDALAAADPRPDIVALQECWTQADYAAIHARTRRFLPHAKFYHSGVLGAGLVLLSRWPIVQSSMYQYPLNGRPTAFFRGDWFVGKGVACTTVRVPRSFASSSPDGPDDDDSSDSNDEEGYHTIELFNTHLHAPYEAEPHDSYLCHRTAQAWDLAKLLRGAADRGHLALALGDFNMLPGSLAHAIVTTHGRAADAWAAASPSSPDDSADKDAVPTAGYNIARHGTTCDSAANTWRWPASLQRRLARLPADDPLTRFDASAPDPRAKRLDYIFVGQPASGRANDETWRVTRAAVGMTQRHPTLHCSLSDHFSVEATLQLTTSPTSSSHLQSDDAGNDLLPPQTYDAITALTQTYIRREQRQRRLRTTHFGLALLATIACLVGVWWTPAGASFALMLLASVGLAAGLLDGLIGGLFVAWEMSALREFAWEVGLARRRAARHGMTDVPDI